MKHFRFALVGLSLVIVLASCGMVNKVFPSKYGCKGNGKNVGAEKFLDGSDVPKAKKFKA